MHQGSKKITAFALLLLVAMPLFFSAGIIIKQKIIQFQRKERLERESLQTISVLSKKLYWMNPGKEVLIDGKLFDVESFKKTGDKTELTGLFDLKEDKLVDHIKDFVDQKNNPDNNTNQLAAKLLLLPNYKENLNFDIENSWHLFTSEFYTYSEDISSLSYPAPAPPPKYC